jgi:hypothetical protein
MLWGAAWKHTTYTQYIEGSGRFVLRTGLVVPGRRGIGSARAAGRMKPPVNEDAGKTTAACAGSGACCKGDPPGSSCCGLSWAWFFAFWPPWSYGIRRFGLLRATGRMLDPLPLPDVDVLTGRSDAAFLIRGQAAPDLETPGLIPSEVRICAEQVLSDLSCAKTGFAEPATGVFLAIFAPMRGKYRHLSEHGTTRRLRSPRAICPWTFVNKF